MRDSRQIEVICVGNELLNGKTLNTNAQWLGKRVTLLGLSLQRITTVGDDLNKISEALQEALNRRPEFIITIGGLGPTFDDKTLAGIAEALNRKLQLNKKALKMIKEKYETYATETGKEKIELTAHRVKMARLPQDAQPLPNPVGTAPGMLLKQNGTIIIALPGVPVEMKAIFEKSVAPMLKQNLGAVFFHETSLYVSGIMESALAPLIDKAMRDNPRVYIKSHPKGKETKPRIELHASATAASLQTAKKQVNKALTQLAKLVKEIGGKTKPGIL